MSAFKHDIFNLYSQYYDLLYIGKEYEAEAAYIDALIKKYGDGGSSILEFGSGTGRHGACLVGRGYKVFGIELSQEMVERSISHDGFDCVVGDIRNFQVHQKFSTVISLFHVMSYQVGDDDISKTFKNAAEHLNVGGLFIFDFWYSPAVQNLRPSVKIKRASDHKTAITRIAEPKVYPNESRVDVHYDIFIEDLNSGEIKNLNEIHSMRHFSLFEIRLLAKKFGFEVLVTEELLTGLAPSDSTWGVCVALRKVP